LYYELICFRTVAFCNNRTAMPVGDSDDLNGGSGVPVNYSVRETPEEKFPRAKQVHGPTLWTVLDSTDGVVQFKDESIRSKGITFGIPFIGGLCFSDRIRMEPNAWNGHWIVRGFGGAPRTKELTLYFPDLIHRCGVQSPYSTLPQHHPLSIHPSCQSNDRQAQHGPRWEDSRHRGKAFYDSASCFHD